MEGLSFGVRKGAWTKEEDLLKKCIEIHGEGKWHQVPSKAGLNRCRKSCRLRWLNYLKPNIKRGDFEDDEVDLIIRLHKLLGNRWSLIAGRLPGRTANDVKNYWNTHLLKKLKPASNKDLKQKDHHPHGRTPSNYPSNSSNKVVVAKPRPRTFRKKTFIRFDHGGNDDKNSSSNNNNNVATTSNDWVAAGADGDYKSYYCNPSDHDEIMRWENLLLNDNEVDAQHDQGGGDGRFNYGNDLNGILGLGDFAKLNSVDEEGILGERGIRKVVEEGNDKSSWDQLLEDVELWNVFTTQSPEGCV